jgi:hypothetical protein
MTRIHTWLVAIAGVAVIGTTSCATAPALRQVRPDQFLRCAADHGTPPSSRVIGRRGGTVQAGENELVLPGNAVSQPTEFTVTPLTSGRVGFHVARGTDDPGQGGPLQRDASVVISVAHCTPEELARSPRWAIYRFEGNAEAGRRLGGVYDAGDQVIWALTNRNSGFIIVAD